MLRVLTYIREDESGADMQLTPEESVSRGTSFKEDGSTYIIHHDSLLDHLIHRYAPALDVPITDKHNKTIAELYFYNPDVLHDLIVFYGGVEKLQSIIHQLDNLYEQHYQQTKEESDYPAMCGN